MDLMGHEKKCPLCGSKESLTAAERVRDYEYGAPGTYEWLRCKSCSLIRLWPVPTDDVLNAAYPETYHAFVRSNSTITQTLIRISRQKMAARIAGLLPPGGTLLDVGCSTGELLFEVGKLGSYKLLGTEYKKEAATAARAKGIHVWEGDLADITGIASASIDVIIMQHVLEHVFDPVVTLQKIHGLLKPGGCVLGELPNFESWDARLFGRYWGGGHAPRHLWHFTPETLKNTIRQCGLEVVAIRPALHTGHWALSFQNLFRRNRRDLDGLKSGRTWYYPLLLLAAVPINCLQMLIHRTGIMRFEARRPA